MMLLAWGVIIQDRATTTLQTITVSRDLIPDSMPTDPVEYDRKYWAVISSIFSTTCGFSSAFMDRPVDVDDLIHRKKQDQTASSHYQISYRVLQAPPFYDEHVTIHHTRFISAGFRNARFLMGQGLRTCSVHTDVILGLEHAEQIDHYIASKHSSASTDYFINAQNMTSKRLGILVLALFSRRRTTPFLCDQTVEIAQPDDRIVLIGMETQAARRMFEQFLSSEWRTFSSNDVKETIEMVAQLHSAYDDLNSAFLHTHNFICQPLPDCAQSHVYFDVLWRSYLPAVSLCSSAFLQNLPNEVQDRLAEVRKVSGPVNDLFTLAMRRNTLWFWGEYLHVQRRLLTRSLKSGGIKVVDSQYSQAALVSSMSGKASAVRECYTVFDTLELEAYFIGRKGTVADECKMDSTWEMFGKRLDRDDGSIEMRWQYQVAPSNVVGIIGEGGSMLDGTPWAKEFCIEFEQGYNNNWIPCLRDLTSLWACAVVSTWNGYVVNFVRTDLQKGDSCCRIEASDIVEGVCYPLIVSWGEKETDCWRMQGKTWRLRESKGRGAVTGDMLRADKRYRRFRWVESTEVVYSKVGEEIAIKVWQAGEEDEKDWLQRLHETVCLGLFSEEDGVEWTQVGNC